jgi:hypothetical protein
MGKNSARQFHSRSNFFYAADDYYWELNPGPDLATKLDAEFVNSAN